MLTFSQVLLPLGFIKYWSPAPPCSVCDPRQRVLKMLSASIRASTLASRSLCHRSCALQALDPRQDAHSPYRHLSTSERRTQTSTMGDKGGSHAKVLTMDTLNPHIKTMEYAVRGPIVARAAAIEKELQQVGTTHWVLYGKIQLLKTLEINIFSLIHLFCNYAPKLYVLNVMK